MGHSGIGTQFKLNINMEPIDGYHMDALDFEFEVFADNNSGKTQTIRKADAIRVDEDNYMVVVDSSKCGAGEYYVKMTAYLPDVDVNGGTRTEKKTVKTGVTIEAW